MVIARKEELCQSRGQKGLPEQVETGQCGSKVHMGVEAGSTLQPLPPVPQGGAVISGYRLGGLPPVLEGCPIHSLTLCFVFAPSASLRLDN